MHQRQILISHHAITYQNKPLTLQAVDLRRHAESQEHKLAQAWYFEPDKPLRTILQETEDDDELLRGAVPQLLRSCFRRVA